MASTRFFNLRSRATEHCFVWLTNTSEIDLVAFVAKCWQEAVAELDAEPPEEAVEEGDYEGWDEFMDEKLPMALQDLIREGLDDFDPEWNNGFLYLKGGCKGGLDWERLKLGFAGGAVDEVDWDVLAKAVVLYVKDLAAGGGVQPLPNTQQEDQ